MKCAHSKLEVPCLQEAVGVFSWAELRSSKAWPYCAKHFQVAKDNFPDNHIIELFSDNALIEAEIAASLKNG